MQLHSTSGRKSQNGLITYTRRYQLEITRETRGVIEKYGMAPVWDVVRDFLQSKDKDDTPPSNDQVAGLLRDLIDNSDDDKGMVIEHSDHTRITKWEIDLQEAIKKLPDYWSEARVFEKKSETARF